MAARLHLLAQNKIKYVQSKYQINSFNVKKKKKKKNNFAHLLVQKPTPGMTKEEELATQRNGSYSFLDLELNKRYSQAANIAKPLAKEQDAVTFENRFVEQRARSFKFRPKAILKIMKDFIQSKLVYEI